MGMKFGQIIAFGVVFFILFALKNSYAVNYDLQQYVSCSPTFCTLTANLSTLGLSTTKINALKTLNLSNYVTKIGTLNNLTFAWNGSALTVSANIPILSSNYWSIGYGGDVLDPWFNSSSISYSAGDTWIYGGTFTGGGSAAGQCRGINYTSNTTGQLNWVARAGGSTDRLEIWNATSFMANISLTGGNATANIPVIAGNYYKITLHDTANEFTSSNGAGLPYNLPYGQITQAIIMYSCDGRINESLPANYMLEIGSLSVSKATITNTSVYYTTNLFMNGVEGNLSANNLSSVNLTLITNLTGLNNSIFVNGTLYNWSLNRVENISFIPSGFWNITGYSANDSTSATVTYYLNMTGDNNAPTYSNVEANDTNPDPLDNVSFSAKWTDNLALSHWLFSWNGTGTPCGTWANDTATAFSGGNWSNVTKTEPSNCAEKTLGFKFYANDTTNNWNVTPIEIIIEGAFDTTPPTYSTVSANTTDAGNTTLFSTFWTDNVLLSKFIFSFDNCTGTLVNDSASAFSGNWSNVTKVVNSTIGCTVRLRYFANDSSNNWNSTAILTYNTTANITFISSSTFSYQTCYDNQTLLTNQTVYHNGNLNNTVEFARCEFGCTNQNCNQNPFYTYIILIIIVLIVLYGIWRVA